MSEITGGYPGGPPRHAEQEGAGPELAHGESVEDRRVEQGASFRKERRQKRLMIGLVISLLAAASAGAYYGIQSKQSAEELAQEENSNRQEGDLDQQTDRILNELWKMEGLERANNR